VVHVTPMPDFGALETPVAVAAMNQALEQLVLQHSDQYLWGYARYKQPRSE